MAIHTWCFKPTEVDYEEARKFLLDRFESDINVLKKSLDDPNSAFRVRLGWTTEHHNHLIQLYQRQIKVIKSGLCKKAVMIRGAGVDVKYFNGKFYKLCLEYLNIFRVSRYYDDVTLTSLSETIDFINNTSNDVFDVNMDNVVEFWEKYPNGIIYCS